MVCWQSTHYLMGHCRSGDLHENGDMGNYVPVYWGTPIGDHSSEGMTYIHTGRLPAWLSSWKLVLLDKDYLQGDQGIYRIVG
jgi:hypothetical protein